MEIICLCGKEWRCPLHESYLFPKSTINEILAKRGVVSANYINHMAMVLDASGSMYRNRETLIKVADAQIAQLAQRSKEMDQETRISVYVFNSTAKCVIYDKDVLRLPSIREFYETRGNTALIDATMKSQDDLSKTAQLYGDHAFLTFVLTDGEENASNKHDAADLKNYLTHLPENWTVACLVPNQRAKFEAKSYGFPADNIAIWDATTTKGVTEVGETIRRATDSYFDLRKSGVRSTNTLFSTNTQTLNKSTVKSAKLKPLPNSAYQLVPVDSDMGIRDWVQSKGMTFVKGACFYQLTKRESIQSYKEIAVFEKSTGKVFAGAQARTLLGLDNVDRRVSPDFNPLFDVFVQSTSTNRKLVTGTMLLVLS